MGTRGAGDGRWLKRRRVGGLGRSSTSQLGTHWLMLCSSFSSSAFFLFFDLDIDYQSEERKYRIQ